jgi:hypothetical protein
MYFHIPVLVPLIFLVSIIPSGITTTNNYFGTTNFAYGQTNQTNTNNKSLGPLNIQNIPAKKSPGRRY